MKKWVLGILVFGMVLSGGCFGEPVYRSTATLLLNSGLGNPNPAAKKDPKLPFIDEFETQKRILKSGMIQKRARQRVGRPASEFKEAIKQIRVEHIDRTSFLMIQVDSTDPVLASELANAMAEEFLEFKAEERMESSQATVISLTQQANRVREQMTVTEEQIIAFSKGNTFASDQAELEAKRKEVLALKTELAGLQSDALKMKTVAERFKDHPPEMAHRILDELGVTKWQSGRSPEVRLKEALASNAIHEEGVLGALASFESELEKVQAAAAEYEKLVKKREKLEEMYSLLFGRLKEADLVVGSGNLDSVRILERAYPASRPR